MKVMATGKDYSTGKPLVEPMDEEDFAKTIGKALPANADTLETKAGVAASALAFRSDPHSVGWSFLVNENDPNKTQNVEALAPLAQHRARKDPSTP